MKKNNFLKKASVEGRGIALKVKSLGVLRVSIDVKSIDSVRPVIGTIYKVGTNFNPSSQPGFTSFLDGTYKLIHVHNNKTNTGFYLVGVEDKHKNDFLNVLAKAIDDISIIDINAPAGVTHLGTIV